MLRRLLILGAMTCCATAWSLELALEGPLCQKLMISSVTSEASLEDQVEEAVQLACAYYASTEDSLEHPEEEALLLQPAQECLGRDYWVMDNEGDRENIRFIVNTLAYTNPLKLWGLQSELELKGAAVEHLHPLRFVLCIFQDESLKAGIHNISETWLAWPNFVSGTADSFQKEADVDNLWDQYLVDFAEALEVELEEFRHLVDAHQWEEFLLWLIHNIPREGDPDRYDF